MLRGPQSGDLGWIVERHGALYRAEYGWGFQFEGIVARIVADFIEADDPKRERCWIAEVDGRRAGCVMVVATDDPAVAKLRVLLVEPWARGLGIGRMLVDAVVSFSRDAGYDRLVLWTNKVLVEARRIYERAGFHLVHEEADESYALEQIAQVWALELR